MLDMWLEHVANHDMKFGLVLAPELSQCLKIGRELRDGDDEFLLKVPLDHGCLSL